MQTAFIYKIKNLTNNKIYIGSTIRAKHVRKYEHFSELRQGKHCNTHLQRSFDKYGERNFKFEIIDTFYFPDNYTKLYISSYLVCREFYLITSLSADYNTRKEPNTGKAGYTHSKETIKKIIESNKKRFENKVLADSTLEKRERESRRVNGILHHKKVRNNSGAPLGRPKGYKHTVEAIEKIRERSLQSDNKLRIRDIQKVASKKRIGTHLSEEQKIKSINTRFGEQKIIEIYNKMGILLNSCNFSTEASLLTGVSRSSVSNNLCGLSKSAGKYIFKYKDNG